MTGREYAIIQLLNNVNGAPLTSAQLSAELNVSPKTIRNDIKAINLKLKPYAIQIQSIRGKGFFLEPHNKEGLRKYFLEDTEKKHPIIPTTSKERVNFLLEKLLFNSDYIKIEDLHTEVFVSRSTLQIDLKSVRQILKKYNLFIEHKPHYGIKIVGKETSIRFCISEYIFNQKPLPLEKQQLNILPSSDLKIIRDSILKNLRKYKIIISDISLHNLLTHIAIAYKRISEDAHVHLEKNDFYQIKDEKEYRVAKEILFEIKEKLGVDFPQNEIVYLSIHLKGTTLVSSIRDNNDMHRFIDSEVYLLAKEMVQRIDNHYGMKLAGDKELLMNLSLHLKPAINRYRYQMNIRNPMLEDIKLNFPLSFAAATTGAEVIYDQFNFRVNEDEVGYIALHLETAQEKSKNTSIKRKRCLIVCASGLGSAQLLLHKVENEFRDRVNVIGTTEYYNLANYSLEDIDFIISTVPIERSLSIPVIYVSTILGHSDISVIEKILDHQTANLEKYIFREYTFLNRDFETPEAVIQFLTNQLIINNQADAGYTQSVLERERQAPTSFGNLVALPHPMQAGTTATILSILTLNKPIEWGGKQVQLVILLNVDKSKKEDLSSLFHLLVQLVDNKHVVFELLSCHTYDQFREKIRIS
ncbi:BglG family transcription antiterminator [Amphibacillus sp. Q70]|uniref:BglG family transcription antiterminator n=1 Tax=Amphibacillus sp. Q70 TaxID=3453416 RepID=UPI003F8374E3